MEQQWEAPKIPPRRDGGGEERPTMKTAPRKRQPVLMKAMSLTGLGSAAAPVFPTTSGLPCQASYLVR